MKKLLVAILAISTLTAFAGSGKHMIRLDGCDDGTCDGLNFSKNSDDASGVSTSATESMDFAINWAMSFGKFGAGLKYVSGSKLTDGKKSSAGDVNSTIGLSGYYNFAGTWDDSCFVAVHYDMVTNEDNETKDTGSKSTVTTIEYGHRFKMGTLGKMNFNWVPSFGYQMTKTTPNASASKANNTTGMTIMPVNFAMTY